MFSRRIFFAGVLLGLAAAAVPALAGAGRYRNVSGLRSGSFVWRPGVDSQDPVTVVVSLAERMLHVYRGSVTVGISTVVLPSPDVELAGDVLKLRAAPPDASLGNERRLWRGTDLTRPQSAGADGESAAMPLVLLPADFAGLLSGVTTESVVAVVARERSDAHEFEAFGPFGKEIETGAILAVDNVARFASPDLGASLSAVPPAEAVVVSRADGAAYHLHAGKVVSTVPVIVEQPEMPLGRHAMVLLAPGDATRPARWLAFALGNERDAERLTGAATEAAMKRIRFADRHRAEALAKGMRPGTALILTDDTGPDSRGAAAQRVAVLGSGSFEASIPLPPQKPPLPPEIAEQVANEAAVAGKLARARRSAMSRRYRRSASKGTQADDAWIDRILRPY
ncbi:MAG: hypothetical protein JNM89_06555 [Hyphomicrobiaceae bacterium]|nr:hypothetical protein [Hyphomicrobiaceae bacterium]